MNKLSRKIAVVVGGHGGIGGAIAERFAAEGATVYATSRRAEEVEVELGAGRLRARRVDASDLTALAAFFEAVSSEAGRVDVLAVNVGISEFATLDVISEDHFDRTFDLNVRALLFAAKAATAIMPDGGSIVLVGSIADAIGTKGYGVYGATKAAVDYLTQVLAKELGPRKIRVNTISPGGVETEGVHAVGILGTDFEKQMVAQTPLGRLGQPSDIGPIAVFLASDDSAWLTGETLSVSGGLR